MVDFVEGDICSITSAFYLCKKKNIVKIRALNQNERMKILSKLKLNKNLIAHYPDLENDNVMKCLSYLFENFLKIYELIKKDNSQNFEKETLERDLAEWLNYFKKINAGEPVTPYVHIFKITYGINFRGIS